MRTTIRLDDQLFAEAKRLALASGRTLSAVIEDALREMIARGKGRSRRRKPRLITDGGRGLRPDACLDRSGALLDIMEGREWNP